MNKEILGMDSAVSKAKSMPYGSNMNISAALVVEMTDRITELENIAYSVQSADLCYGSYSTYEIDGDVVEKAKELLKEQDDE